MEHSTDIIITILGPGNTYPFQTDFFSDLAYRPHVSGENGHRKRIFSNTLSRIEIFKNTVLLFLSHG